MTTDRRRAKAASATQAGRAAVGAGRPQGPQDGQPGGRTPVRRFEIALVSVLTAALSLLYLAARDSTPFQPIEGKVLDWRFAVRGPQTPGPDVVQVLVDDRTLAGLGRWPFSRIWLQRAVDAISADGAKTIVFDLLATGNSDDLSNPGDRTSPGDEIDQALAASIVRAGNVVVPYAFVMEAGQANQTDLPPAIVDTAYKIVRSEGEGASRRTGHPSGLLTPNPGFLTAGHPAHVTVIFEDDGNLRFSHPALRYGEGWYPSLAIEAARLYLGIDRGDVVLDLDRGVLLGDRLLETGKDLALPINYAGPEGTYPSVSLIDVANGKVAPGTFKNRIVLIGAAAVGLGDRFVTPYSPDLPGVEAWANVIDDILHRGFLRRVPPETDVLVIIAGGLLALLCGALGRTALALTAMAVLTLGWCILNFTVFTAAQVWLNFTFPAASIVLGTIVVVAGRSLRESRLRLQGDRDRRRMARYVPPLAAGHAAAPEGGGQSRMAVIMFVDLVGYTKASEDMTPAATAALLRRFHHNVERVVTDFDGVIDKFIGDAVLAVFGLPEAGPDHAAAAVACARRIAADLADWDAELKAAGSPGIGCGAGLHFGPVVVAEVGGAEHAQVTVTGDTVNVASRLEALTRSWRTTIIASDAVVDAARSGTDRAMLDGFTALPFQEIRGRDRPVGIWCWPAPPAEDVDKA